MDAASVLWWKMRAQRSRRRLLSPLPPQQYDADEYYAAKALILLANSAGGFCATAIATASPIIASKKHREVHHSATAIAKKQQATSPDTPLPPPFHHCWLCGKVFESSKVLGGHMTCQRMKIIGNAEDQGPRRSCSASAAANGGVHECSFCHQTFATGQALGGHKRRHYDGPTITRKAAKCESSTSPKRIAGETSVGGSATRHVRPIIDLNLPPPPESEL